MSALTTQPIGLSTAQSGSANKQPAAPQDMQLREAAEAFEAIFVRRMLATARSGPFSEDGPLSSGAGLKQFTAMRDENVAEMASQNGGFGLADQIERQLSALVTQKEA